ncbi:uncharacterized protein [Gossypium hirsutum]|uniref:Sec23/Sec24 trunk domain-containing protein n=1 Tax=Gossypium hirsutum TaxID=3635 RepID=A0ABM3A9G7_GOSHI|nr:uncharacterized protein LOC107899946 [Gossypium hirsutum]
MIDPIVGEDQWGSVQHGDAIIPLDLSKPKRGRHQTAQRKNIVEILVEKEKKSNLSKLSRKWIYCLLCTFVLIHLQHVWLKVQAYSASHLNRGLVEGNTLLGVYSNRVFPSDLKQKNLRISIPSRLHRLPIPSQINSILPSQILTSKTLNGNHFLLPPTPAFLPFIQGQSPKSLYSDLLFFRQTNTRFVDLFLVYLPPNQWDNDRFCNHYRPGQLNTRRYGEQYASKREDADCALLPEQTPFYKDLAAVAVQAGVCVDIFAVTNEYTDLASLKFLSIESGGSLFLYANTDDSTLPQDMYQMLSRPYAFTCVLRLRTSIEFKPDHSYGHFFPDPQYENVQHIICCDFCATYAYDFDFANNVGFYRY